MRDVVTEWAEANEIILTLADGFDAAIHGVGRQFNHHVVLYDRRLCITILEGQGMTREEAEEHFEFNVVGSFVGETTPVFIESLEI
jgi:hypothetical protein